MDSEFDLPRSIKAEEALLGGVLVNPTASNLLDLEPDDFFIHRHGFIWKAILDLRHEGTPVDFLTISNWLEEAKLLHEVGGDAYLAELVSKTVSALHVESYAQIIKDRANRRRAIAIANEIAKAAFNYEKEFEASVFAQNLAGSMRTSFGAQPIQYALREFMQLVDERMENPKEIYGIETGISELDARTYGLHKGQGMLFAAPPGVGKSMFWMQVAVWLGENSTMGAYYAMEMSGVSFASRAVSAITRIGTEKYFQGNLTQEQYAIFLQTVARLEKAKVQFSGRSVWSLSELRADLTRLKMTQDLDWFIIDYLGLLRNGGYKSEAEEIAYKSEGLLSIAKDLDIALVAIHTLTKSGQMTERPNLTDMRGSGSDYGFDRVWFMVQEQAEGMQNLIHFVPGKARHEKPPTMFTLVKSPDYPHFASAAPADLAALEEGVTETEVTVVPGFDF